MAWRERPENKFSVTELNSICTLTEHLKPSNRILAQHISCLHERMSVRREWRQTKKTYSHGCEQAGGLLMRGWVWRGSEDKLKRHTLISVSKLGAAGPAKSCIQLALAKSLACSSEGKPCCGRGYESDPCGLGPVRALLLPVWVSCITCLSLNLLM